MLVKSNIKHLICKNISVCVSIFVQIKCLFKLTSENVDLIFSINSLTATSADVVKNVRLRIPVPRLSDDANVKTSYEWNYLELFESICLIITI